MDNSSVPPAFPLEGKRILVTGAAKRIGRAIALYLHQRGARVLLHYGHSREEAEALAGGGMYGGGRAAPLFQ
ncbi:MAG: hypothetical protein U5J83_04615, partial [Bryobacterales bacterium]|nr:hypothetical protein [Bryobacterales bacterium]